jgi:hypothetical protein
MRCPGNHAGLEVTLSSVLFFVMFTVETQPKKQNNPMIWLTLLALIPDNNYKLLSCILVCYHSQEKLMTKTCLVQRTKEAKLRRNIL